MTNVLALHCGLASGAAWRPLVSAMRDRRFLTPDLPGHGQSEPFDPSSGDFMDVSLDRALHAMEGRPMDVVGHSYGGCVALRLAVERPDLVRHLTLIEPVMFAAAPPDTMARHWDDMAPFAAALDQGDRYGAAKVFHQLWGVPAPYDALPEAARSYIEARIHLIRETEAGIVADKHDILDRLDRVTAPVQIIRREYPPDIVGGIVTGLQARMPRADDAYLGRTHMIPQDMPGELAGLLQSFWQG